MREINITELRNHLHKYLDSVQKGNEILITLHGHIIARILSPIDKKQEAINQLKELCKRSKMTDIISPIDDADRVIAATAIQHNADLITCDSKLNQLAQLSIVW